MSDDAAEARAMASEAADGEDNEESLFSPVSQPRSDGGAAQPMRPFGAQPPVAAADGAYVDQHAAGDDNNNNNNDDEGEEDVVVDEIRVERPAVLPPLPPPPPDAAPEAVRSSDHTDAQQAEAPAARGNAEDEVKRSGEEAATTYDVVSTPLKQRDEEAQPPHAPPLASDAPPPVPPPRALHIHNKRKKTKRTHKSSTLAGAEANAKRAAFDPAAEQPVVPELQGVPEKDEAVHRESAPENDARRTSTVDAEPQSAPERPSAFPSLAQPLPVSQSITSLSPHEEVHHDDADAQPQEGEGEKNAEEAQLQPMPAVIGAPNGVAARPPLTPRKLAFSLNSTNAGNAANGTYLASASTPVPQSTSNGTLLQPALPAAAPVATSLPPLVPVTSNTNTNTNNNINGHGSTPRRALSSPMPYVTSEQLQQPMSAAPPVQLLPAGMSAGGNVSRLQPSALAMRRSSSAGSTQRNLYSNHVMPPRASLSPRPPLPRSSTPASSGAEVLLPLKKSNAVSVDRFFVEFSERPVNERAGEALGGDAVHLAARRRQPENEDEMLLEQFAEYTDDDSVFSSGATVLVPNTYRYQLHPLRARAVCSVQDALELCALRQGRNADADIVDVNESKAGAGGSAYGNAWLFQIHRRALALHYSSFFVFPPCWTPRVVVYNVLHHWLFELLLFWCIVGYAVFQASWARYSAPKGQEGRPDFMLWADVFYTVLLGFECLARLFASGCVLHPRAYFRSPWRWLDTAVLVMMILECTWWRQIWNFTAWRLLRTVKCLTYLPAPIGMKLIAKSYLRATNQLLQFSFLGLYFIFFFALLGLHLFNGTLRNRCVNQLTGEVTRQVCRPTATGRYWFYWGHACSAGYECVLNAFPNPHYDFRSFDDIGHSLLSVFQIVTFQGWTALLQETNDGVAVMAFLFYFFAILICTWVVAGLCLGIFLDKLDRSSWLYAQKQLELYESMLNEQRQRMSAMVRLCDYVERDAEGRVPYYPAYTARLTSDAQNGGDGGAVGQKELGSSSLYYSSSSSNNGHTHEHHHKAGHLARMTSWAHRQQPSRPRWTDEQRVQLHLSLTRQQDVAAGAERKRLAEQRRLTEENLCSRLVGGATPGSRSNSRPASRASTPMRRMVQQQQQYRSLGNGQEYYTPRRSASAPANARRRVRPASAQSLTPVQTAAVDANNVVMVLPTSNNTNNNNNTTTTLAVGNGRSESVQNSTTNMNITGSNNTLARNGAEGNAGLNFALGGRVGAVQHHPHSTNVGASRINAQPFAVRQESVAEQIRFLQPYSVSSSAAIAAAAVAANNNASKTAQDGLPMNGTSVVSLTDLGNAAQMIANNNNSNNNNAAENVLPPQAMNVSHTEESSFSYSRPPRSHTANVLVTRESIGVMPNRTATAVAASQLGRHRSSSMSTRLSSQSRASSLIEAAAPAAAAAANNNNNCEDGLRQLHASLSEIPRTPHPMQDNGDGMMTPSQQQQPPLELIVHDPEGGDYRYAPTVAAKVGIMRNIVHMFLFGYPRVLTQYVWEQYRMQQRYRLAPLTYTNKYEEDAMRKLRARRAQERALLREERRRRGLLAEAEEEEDEDEDEGLAIKPELMFYYGNNNNNNTMMYDDDDEVVVDKEEDSTSRTTPSQERPTMRRRANRKNNKAQGGVEGEGEEEEEQVCGRRRGRRRYSRLAGLSPIRMTMNIMENTWPTPFGWFMYFLIFINAGFNVSRYDSMPDYWENGLFISSVVFSALFTLEQLARLFALGPGPYFFDLLNLIEVVAVVCSLFQLGFSRANTISIFNWVRFLRLARLLPIRPLRHVTRILMRGFGSLFYALVIFTLLMFMWLLLGMSFFGSRTNWIDNANATTTRDDYSTRGSFETFSYAAYAVAQTFTWDRTEWALLSWNGMRVRGSYTIMYFILTAVTAFVVPYLFLAIWTNVWLGFDEPQGGEHEGVGLLGGEARRATSNNADNNNNNALDLYTRSDGGIRAKLPWFDFTVWRSFKHIHGGFARRDVAPDEVYQLNEDMRRELRLAETKERAFRAACERARGAVQRELRGEQAGGYGAEDAALQYVNINGQLYRRRSPDAALQELAAAEGAASPAGPSDALVEMNALYPNVPQLRYTRQFHVVPAIAPYDEDEYEDEGMAGGAYAQNELNNEAGSVLLDGAGNGGRNVLTFPSPDRNASASPAAHHDDVPAHVSTTNNTVITSSVGHVIVNPMLANRHSLSTTRNVAAAGAGVTVGASRTTPFPSVAASRRMSALANGGHSALNASPPLSAVRESVHAASVQGVSEERADAGGEAMTAPAGLTVPTRLLRLGQAGAQAPVQPGAYGEAMDGESATVSVSCSSVSHSGGGAMPRAAHMEEGQMFFEHVLLPGPRLRYKSVLVGHRRVFEVCVDCNTHKQMPLRAPPIVAQRSADDLHAEHCHVAAARSSRQLVLTALLGYARLQADHHVSPTREMMEMVLGQAWSCGMLLFETVEHVAGEDVPAEERSWTPLLEALELQQWLLGLHVGEEQVGRATLAYLLAHQQIHEVHERETRYRESWQSYSFFLFAPSNPLRRGVCAIVSSVWFEAFMLCVIFAASICLACYIPGDDGDRDLGGYYNRGRYKALHILDDIFTVLLTVELGLKWLAMGVMLPVGEAYFWHLWNIFSCFIVVISLVSWGDHRIYLRYLKVMLCFRLLSPLRRWRAFPAMAHVAQSIWISVPTLANIALLMLLHCIVWALLFCSMFMNKMNYCDDARFATRAACEQNNARWRPVVRNFRNFYESLLTTFELSTGAEWLPVMYNAVDSWSTAEAMRANRRPYKGLVFIAYYYLSHFVLFSLFMSAMIYCYLAVRRVASGAAGLSREHRMWLRMQELLLHLRPAPRLLPVCHNAFWRAMHRMLVSCWFEFTMGLILLLNAITIALEWHGMNDTQEKTLRIFQYVFVGIFTAEIVLRLCIHGLRSFTRWAFCWDVLVMCLSYIQIGLNTTTRHSVPFNMNVLRLLRVGRVFTVFSTFAPCPTYFSFFLHVLWAAVPGLVSVGFIHLLAIYVFTILGLHFLGDIVPYAGGFIDGTYNNFRTFVNSLIMVFRLSTLESWAAMLRGSMRQQSHRYCDRANGRCGPTNWAPVYYVPIVLLFAGMIVPLYMAVLLDYFIPMLQLRTRVRRLGDLQVLSEAWARRDPNATGVLPTCELPALLEELRPPLGLSSRHKRSELLRLLREYGLADHDGWVYYDEVLLALARRVTAMALHEAARVELHGDIAGGNNMSSAEVARRGAAMGVSAWSAGANAKRAALAQDAAGWRGAEQSMPLLFANNNNHNNSSNGGEAAFTAAEYFAVCYLQAAYRRDKAQRDYYLRLSALWCEARQACLERGLSIEPFGFGRWSLTSPDPREEGRRRGFYLPDEALSIVCANSDTTTTGAAAMTAAGLRIPGPIYARAAGIRGTNYGGNNNYNDSGPAAYARRRGNQPKEATLLPIVYRPIIQADTPTFGPDSPQAIQRHERRSEKLERRRSESAPAQPGLTVEAVQRGTSEEEKEEGEEEGAGNRLPRSPLRTGTQEGGGNQTTNKNATSEALSRTRSGRQRQAGGSVTSAVVYSTDPLDASYQPPLGTDPEVMRRNALQRQQQQQNK